MGSQLPPPLTWYACPRCCERQRPQRLEYDLRRNLLDCRLCGFQMTGEFLEVTFGLPLGT